MLLWNDLESTGLDFKNDYIIQVAFTVTDDQLNVVSEFASVVEVPKVIPNLTRTVLKMHLDNKLWDACLKVGQKIHVVEEEAMNFIKRHFPDPNDDIILAGSSIHFDRTMLRMKMPKLERLLHYRMVDVSSFKEMVKRIDYQAYENRPKPSARHEARSDIRDSIEELKYYLSFLRFNEAA